MAGRGQIRSPRGSGTSWAERGYDERDLDRMNKRVASLHISGDLSKDDAALPRAKGLVDEERNRRAKERDRSRPGPGRRR